MTDAIDKLMKLADEYATLTADTAAVTKARQALRTALTEALVSKLKQPAWRCTGEGLKKYLTQTQYDAQTEKVKAWYEPFSPTDQSPILTIGQCKEKAQPGGCQLHNLQCGYPTCDSAPASPTVSVLSQVNKCD